MRSIASDNSTGFRAPAGTIGRSLYKKISFPVPGGAPVFRGVCWTTAPCLEEIFFLGVDTELAALLRTPESWAASTQLGCATDPAGLLRPR